MNECVCVCIQRERHTHGGRKERQMIEFQGQEMEEEPGKVLERE